VHQLVPEDLLPNGRLRRETILAEVDPRSVEPDDAGHLPATTTAFKIMLRVGTVNGPVMSWRAIRMAPIVAHRG